MLWKYIEMKEEMKKFWNFPGICFINMVGINRKTYKTNDLETVVDSDGIFWLTEKHIEEVLDHKKVWLTPMK